MKERSIIFGGEMVRALLEGRKTQTRRVIKPQPNIDEYGLSWSSRLYDNGLGANSFHTKSLSPSIMDAWANACSYGKPGDLLWVREAFAEAYQMGKNYFTTMIPTSASSRDAMRTTIYKATAEVPPTAEIKWKSSRFMPRTASRITLEITNVRVERLQDISEEDAKAEGVPVDDSACDHVRLRCADIGCLGPGYRSSFCELWEKINGKKHPWASNPWVWVVEFNVLKEGME